jgi:hypothetical protein
MIVAIISRGIHNTSQYLVLEYLYVVYVACGCTPPELDAIRLDGICYSMYLVSCCMLVPKSELMRGN